MRVNTVIFRVFEVRAKSGHADVLKHKLSSTSVSVVSGKPGNLGYFFGPSLSSDENELVFISVWKDLESVVSLFGKDWEASFLPDGYDDIIETCSIKHLEVDGRLVAQDSAGPG